MLGTLHGDLNTFYCCQTHKFPTKAFLCSTQYLYTADSDI